MDLPSGKLDPVVPVRHKRPTEVEREANVVAAKQRKPKPRAVAKKSNVTPKGPKFLCHTHKALMVYSAELGHWYCTAEGCNHTRKAQVGGDADTVTHIHSAPKVVCKYDEDGDPTYYLFYEAENVMVNLPYGSIVGHQVFSRSITPAVVVSLKSEDFVFIDSDGDAIPVAEVMDR